jgi:maltose alpha-D-glucosyltransferase/alpha-amylase
VPCGDLPSEAARSRARRGLDVGPLTWALQQTSKKPEAAQWVHFLRSHDELDLGRLSPEQRTAVFKEFAPDKSMQLYDRGIRAGSRRC